MKKKKIEGQILKKIKSGEIQMKPRWKFVVKMWEERALWLVLILAVVLSISGIAYFADKYSPRELVEYGSIGFQVFYEDFPYYWLFGAIIFWIMSVKMWSRLGNNYRKTTTKVFLFGGLLLVVIIALILFLG
ncbi:MAG: hypothetical protein US68_C0026G0009 [Candidatus Shapirobacteria bacterium GW2011_GWE1_38_10]|uniref:Uncharacterized protein n=1 Tax=Candidatus Shapirobacteria bacterium GW2011_GWE1_38_10 TaxID=1618488 RepID=A0A0G0ICK6_9BACT|nr:MAG: hypothetical protein US46_C0005G0008 [Candidatus Shapirobacteria bacterium GW2011_GWF2_37_20]KKQ48695.1 MAG: hypothetical protein US68_C0026G0009 [Candidatus Shapirobacteria bacterium GW2011_GWE1_38_10]KKQ62673.1 MAG: hypothetical protein US85_C0023G0004 [Candidatus Shapirobacteria bacterium GW2011_GWF1_38_23]HBP50838.1 hypothetical protein [Candidatus Shapirobacteria bacterium]